MFAGLLFTAGALGDRYGRKGALQLGLLSSSAARCSPPSLGTAEGVIIGRAVMGLGAAFVMPSTLSILTNVFPPTERAKAIAIWAGIVRRRRRHRPHRQRLPARALLLGLGLPGQRADHPRRARSPARVLLPKSQDPEQARLDPVGALLSIAGPRRARVRHHRGARHGWASAETLGLVRRGAIVLIGLFVAWELHGRHPMLDLPCFKDRRFSVAAGGITLVFFAMFGTFFLVTQYFQLVLGYGALEAGLLQLPMAVSIMAVAPQTPELAARFGANRVGRRSGSPSSAVGLLLFDTLDADTPYPVAAASRC